MQPIPIDSSNDAISHSIAKQTRSTVAKVDDSKSINNVNELCDRLRVLLSSMTTNELKNREEINAIMMKLYDLEILV